MRAFIVLLSLALYGCAPTSPYITRNNNVVRKCSPPILFGVAFNTHKVFRKPIRDAFQYWNTVTGKDLFFDLGVVPWEINDPLTNGFIPVDVMSIDDPWLSQHLKVRSCGALLRSPPNRTGCVGLAKIVAVAECVDSLEKLNTILRHEIGHLLGLKDTPDFTKLMSVRVENTLQHPVDASKEEIDAVIKLYQQ